MFSFLADICQVPILYYASGSSIYTYNTKAGDHVPKEFLTPSDATLLVYDRTNRTILLYSPSTDVITRVSLDGSNTTTLATVSNEIERFTYDGKKNIVYYLDENTKDIRMLNLHNMNDSPVDLLANVSNVRDLDIDLQNE